MAEIWGAIGAATIGGILSSDGDDQRRTTEEPEWLQSAERSALSRAEQIADRPYTPYTGQRVAGLSGNEREASQLARTGLDPARSYIDQAGERISELERFDQANLRPYMNPYIDAVLEPQLREANRAFEREQTRILNSKAGAWGGDRVAFETSELGRRHGELITDITNRAHSEAFDRAVQLWSQDQDRALRAADALRSVGGDLAQLNRQQIQDLMATGGLERMLEQAELDFDYQQFIERRDWSVNNLQPLLQAISASKGGNATVTDHSESGTLGQILGAGLAVAGMYFGGMFGKDDKGEGD